MALKVDGPTVKLRLEAEGPEITRSKTLRSRRATNRKWKVQKTNSGKLKQIESGRYEVENEQRP